jgi:hypothetical protein
METATIAGQVWTVTRYQHFVTLVNERGTARSANYGIGPMWSLAGQNHKKDGNVIYVEVTATEVKEYQR